MKTYTVKVLEYEMMTPEMYRLRIEKPAGFSYHPGQSIAIHHWNDRRFYSLSSHPSENFIELGIKIKQGGKFSSHLMELVGKPVEISGPYGVLWEHIPEKGRICFMAIGSGISPIISILKDFSISGRKPAMLLYGEKSVENVPFKNELGSFEWLATKLAFSSEGVHVQGLFQSCLDFQPDVVIGIGSLGFVGDVRQFCAEHNLRCFTEGFG